MKKILVGFAVILTLTAVLISCESSGGSAVSDDSNYKYSLNGFFVQNVNLTSVKPAYNHFAATMTRNSLEFSTAQLFFGTSALEFGTTFNINDSVYTFENASNNYKTPATSNINIVDSTFFTGTVTSLILDSIWVTNGDAFIPPNTNGTATTVEWSSALGIDGYIVAVVLADSAYNGTGYSAYVTEDGTSTTIPPDAFRVNNAVVTGSYDVYVYGYSGSPDMALSSIVLPVPLPSQLPDNISQTNLTGHFGSIVVTRKVTIQVVSG